jgi:predicted transcriptional regulator
MAIGEYCNREVVVAHPEVSAKEAARLMRKYHVGSLVLVNRTDHGLVPIGVVTDRDLVVELMALDLDNTPTVSAGELLCRELVTVNETEDVLDVVEKMQRSSVRRLPVVNQQGFLIGIITSDDILDALADALDSIARLGTDQGKHEQRVRT